MTLFWPKTEAEVVLDQPRLHALVIGVGKYDHLGLSAVRLSSFLSGLGQLETTAPSAKQFATWLQEHYCAATVELGSVELLLSPTDAAEASSEIQPATMANVKQAVKLWYDRCSRQERSIAMLYFAGHGFRRGAHDYLLPQDFGDPSELDEWAKCIDGTGLVEGMKKCKADTQLYFFDACRDEAFDAQKYRTAGGNPLIRSTIDDHVSVSVVYRAAAEGGEAWGNKEHGITYFWQALLMCLNGVGGRKTGPKWAVDAASLSTAMASVGRLLEKREGIALGFDSTGARDVPIHSLQEARVFLQVDLLSGPARQNVEIEVVQAEYRVSNEPDRECPWASQVRPGDTTIAARTAGWSDSVHESLLYPPVYEWTLDQ